MCCSRRLWRGQELWPLVVCDELNCWLRAPSVRVGCTCTPQEGICLMSTFSTDCEEYMRHVILESVSCYFVCLRSEFCARECVIVCVCVGRMFVTVKIMIPLLCFLQLLQWTESIATTTINPRSSYISVCAHTQTCNCHTRAPSGWTSRIDRSAIETPVRNLSRFFSLFASTSDS